MNKFNQFINETEGKSREIFEYKSPIIEFLIREKLKKKSIDILKKEKNLTGDLLIDSIACLNEMPKEYIEWLKKDILKNYHSVELLKITLSNLTYNTYFKKDRNKLYKELESLKISQLVDDIFYIENKNIFRIKIKNKIYSIQPCAKKLRYAKDAEGNCHEYTEKLLRENSMKLPLDGCCVIFRDLFHNPHFHSFCINSNNIVIDPAYNITSNLDLYLNGLDHQILFRENGSEIIKNIDYLNITDKDFQKSEKIDFLKYALLKGEENYNNQKLLKKSLNK